MGVWGWQASMRTLVTSCQQLGHQCHTISSTSPLSARPSVYPKELQWFERLTRPVSEVDSAEGTQRILDLLRLRSACACERTDFDQLTVLGQKEAAFEFAREIPFFDRDLTSFYMGHDVGTEYELHVGHSLLRMAPSTSLSHFTQHTFPRWREQGLLHVLAIAAVHMPSAQEDWGVEDEGLAALLASLPASRSYDQAGTLDGS